ncbi:MAG: FimV/HubP family polar landmark protein [Steroidobacter sp.]
MRRHLPRLLLTGALLSPVTLFALGLGEIRLNSALNQPFDAEIELISPTADELQSLKVGLASNDLFSRYGLDRPSYLSGFDFSVSRTRDGRASIKVRSNRSVTEPFVTLLVEASWARGRLLREYTVLLDPPVFMPSQSETPAPVTTPQSGARTEGRIERQPTPQPEPEPSAEPARPAPTPEQPAAPVAAAPATLDGEYTVERNDTLWRIANRVNPGSPSVVNQTMIALFRANPAAFGGNINRLRAGSVLRIPEISEIEAVSGGEASMEVARQTAEWSGAEPAQVADDASRLRLVTPEETPAAPTAAAPTPEQTAPERPGAAPGEPSAEDKRLEITSPELAAAQENVDETPAEPAPGSEPGAEDPNAAVAPPAAEAPQAQRPAQTPVQSAPEPAGPTLAERISQFWWAPVVLGLLVVIGLIVAFVRRRRDAEDSSSLDSIAPMHFEPAYERAPAASTRSRDRSDSFLVEGEPAAEETFDEPAPVTARRTEQPKTRPVEPAAPVAASRTADDTLSSETAVRFDQQDALAEADFHMAYGLYDQAADLVKIAIDREPGRRDLKLKLLEIYFVWGNKDLFLDTARDLHGTRGEAAAGEWDKVLIMGKQIAPEDPMFKGEASAGLDLVDVNLEGGENRVDVDLFAEPENDKPVGLDLEFASGERKAPADGDESDLDFLLDEPRSGADEEPTRELDPLARTQETPTIESPQLHRSSDTIRERADKTLGRANAEQTAELSLDDLGLDVNALDNSGSLEDTTSLEKDTGEHEIAPHLNDDEMTQLAPSLSSFDRTIEAPRPDKGETGKFDIESTGTIYIDQVDLSGGDTVEQPRPDVDATASMKRSGPLDVDLDMLSDAPESHDTIRHPRAGETEQFSSDVFADRTAESPRIDLDVGDPLSAEDHEPTNKQVTTEMELSELEPVTMSEVGTKLDLARAYMDMGDPDGARSILEEVQAEGNPNQKQEAQRLLDSIR